MEVRPNIIALVPQEAMQYGRALERYLRHILLADTKFGPVYMLKFDLVDGYYRIGLIQDIPKLALAFPPDQQNNHLIALPLVLLMGLKKSGPVFCAATEILADIANATVSQNVDQPPYHLDTRTRVVDYNAKPPSIILHGINLSPAHPYRNPMLQRPNPRRAAYIDIFVDDFIALVQGCP